MPDHVVLDESSSRSSDGISSTDVVPAKGAHTEVAHKKGDGKSEISGAVFNLANAVRSGARL